MTHIPPEFRAAYLEHERELTIRKTRLGCLLGAIFVPLFAVLDQFVYEAYTRPFLVARLICSALMFAMFPLIDSRLSRKYFQAIGVVILFMPSATIAWMVYATEGAASTYYAGLILVMMFLAVLLDWTFWQSVASVSLVWILYLLACFLSPAPVELDGPSGLVNNLFFLMSTGIVIMISSWFHSDLRRREFVSRCELEKANREIKEAEAQIVQSEKMSSLGRHSAGLMHEILNPLNIAIQGCFAIRKAGRNLPEGRQTDFNVVLNDTEEGLRRIKKIVQDLKMFAYAGGQPLETANLSEQVNIALRSVSDRLTELNILVENEVIPDQTIFVERDRFNQVLVNLFNNSIEAMESKRYPAGQQPEIRVTSSVEDGRNLVFIRDNGPGIPPESQSKVFEPFYTTKDFRKGTGLGLSICFGIIRGFGGKIDFKTEPGRFTEFILDLPADEPKNN